MSDRIEKWVYTVWLSIICLCVSVMLFKLVHDLLNVPNIFAKEEAVIAQPDQKQTDELCVKWFFTTNLEDAKKRICRSGK